MKLRHAVLTSLLIAPVAMLIAQSDTVRTIDDYNNILPNWGVSWAPGKSAVNGYYPSFYTGFAMRSEYPERIHVRIGRGNQTRVSVILDEETVTDYVFDLATRYEFYKDVTTGDDPLVKVVPDSDGKVLPQLSYFSQVIESPEYGILEFVAAARRGEKSSEETYQKALAVLQALNPGRVFNIRLNLTAEFSRWREQMKRTLAGTSAATVFKDDSSAISALNTLVWGRVNFTSEVTSELRAQLELAAELAIQDASDEQFVPAALALFKMATGTKYDLRVLMTNGQWASAIQCASAVACELVYPEFSAIYPTGSAMSSTKDRFGNRISNFATPGLWQFLSRRYHEVDNIRDEPYYGWAPKMDYEAAGNGFHNPAVRFVGFPNSVREILGLSSDHTTLWAVKRGAVSSGCSRLPLGHIWEMRHIFPVENAKMERILHFGNESQDFDVYDIDGDGNAEVMGVNYMISYDLKGTSGLGRREGANLEINSDAKLAFYNALYGSKNVFTVTNDGTYVFTDPSVSMPSILDYQKSRVKTRLTMTGEYPLYEQEYEREKVQFYSTERMSTLTENGQSPRAKRIVRLLGRVRGCAPTSDASACGQAAFDQEVTELLGER